MYVYAGIQGWNDLTEARLTVVWSHQVCVGAGIWSQILDKKSMYT